jgi:hypothetical protein
LALCYFEGVFGVASFLRIRSGFEKGIDYLGFSSYFYHEQMDRIMKFDKAVPILYSKDVSKSIAYFVEQLKFEHKWEWDSPPNFGGVSRDNVEVFFCQNDQGNPATWLCVVLDDVDDYHDQIKGSGAKILSPPDTKEWNMREMLVECPDGHIIRFGHNTSCD